MKILEHDFEVLRRLAEEYASFALADEFAKKPDEYRKLNSLNQIRPPVLVFEVPYSEFSDCDELRLQCHDPSNFSLENNLRREIYKCRHFRGDFILHPYFRSGVAIKDTGIGVNIDENTAASTTGSDIKSHYYNDRLKDEEDLAKIRMPEVSHDLNETNRRLEYHSEIFKDIMGVKKSGVSFYLATWDLIPRLHGVETSIMDLCERPEFIHAIMEKFTAINLHYMDEYERLNVLDTDPNYLHCAPACTNELPVLDMDKDKITTKDVWCRAMAQIFSVVPPEMHEEFDLRYTRKYFERCGLNYYGCCEPLDEKIDILRKLPKLRRISITPWANVENAAEKIGKDFVLSYKSNPAFVAGKSFDERPVIEETKRVMDCCLKNGTPFEFILKDISTVSNNPSNIEKWMETVNRVIDSY